MEMEFQKARLIAALALAPAFAPAPAFAQTLDFPARHAHLRKYCSGTLSITEQGVSYRETGSKKPHAWMWSWDDIQQLDLTPDRIRVLTYQDSRWKLGADRKYEFRGKDFESAYALLSNGLGRRFVARMADDRVDAIWQIPVKHLTRFGGDEGTLIIGRDHIVFKSPSKGDSRTWRYRDIESISTSDPFQLTLTTFERAWAHYGSRKDFNFQLRRPLEDARYNDLWRRLNKEKP
jgi:hypothetical protein